MEAGLSPPPVRIERSATVLEYWRGRAAQHTHDSYAGVPISKFPEDLRVYEHLLWQARANVVIEIGTHHGGSALWFRDRLRTNRAYGRIAAEQVISIDVDTELAAEQIRRVDPSGGESIVLLEADVRDPSLPDRVAQLLPVGARCLVVEDSAHVYDTTLAALNGFARFVSEDGFLVVEDGCVDVEELRIDPSWPRGVLPALSDWLASPAAAGFVVRGDLELYGISCHPGGFLQRTGPAPTHDPVVPAGDLAAAAGTQRATVTEALRAELAAAPAWMYDWNLGDGLQAPVLDSELPSIHRTRAELAEPAVRQVLAEAAAAGETSALDIACNEGWFAQRLLDWGAGRVLGVDIREQNIRRAGLVADHLGLDRKRLSLLQADAFELDPAQIGTFDVVLLLGLIYHVEDPIGLIRRTRALTRRLCVIESQLTRQDVPILHGWGSSGQYMEAPGSFALRLEPDSDQNLLASSPGVVSLIPNRSALREATLAAGFSRAEFPVPRGDHNLQYRLGDRALILAWC